MFNRVIKMAALCFAALLAGQTQAQNYTDSSKVYSSKQPYNLNVVYFVPKDLSTLPRYQERLSEILLSIQSFTKKQMTLRGQANAEMGLLVNKQNLVKITTIKGKENHPHYAYASAEGSEFAQKEIEAYFAKYPAEKTSQHVLVIMPTRLNPKNENGLEWGPPFFGVGKYCFALDYVEMEQKYLGRQDNLGELASNWIGGLAHELGHGLNQGHDKSLASEQNSKGESLMSAGNSTYGASPTQLTAASAAIFNTSQIFQKSPVADLYERPKFEYSNLKASASNGKVMVTGNFKSNKAVDSIIAFLDPEGGEDYNQVGWVQKPQNNSFSFSMPVSELENRQGKAVLRLATLFKNGYTDESFSLPFEFKNQQAVINYSQQVTVPKAGWRIVSASSSTAKSPAVYAIDGDRFSAWRSDYERYPEPPHTLIIDTAKVQTMNGVLLSHANQDGALDGVVKDFKLYTSLDGRKWVDAGSFQNTRKSAVSSSFAFKAPVNARYLKIVVNSNWDTDYFIYVGFAEVDIF